MSIALKRGMPLVPEADTAAEQQLAAGAARVAPLWRRETRTFAALTALADFGTALAIVLLWQHGAFRLEDPRALALLPVVWVLVLAGTGWYASPRIGSDALLRGAVFLIAVEWFVGLVTGHRMPGELLAAMAILCALGSLGHRWAVQVWAEHHGVVLPGQRRRVVVVGHTGPVEELHREVVRARGCGLDLVGVCLLDPHPQELRFADNLPVAAGLGHLGRVLTLSGADTALLLPCSHLDAATVRRTAWQLEQYGTRLVVGTPLHGVARSRTRLAGSMGLPMLEMRHARLSGPGRVVKEVWERCAAALALVVLSPVLLGLMVAVRLDSHGPALFRQTRVGRDDLLFRMLKLRTMTVDAEARRDELVPANQGHGILFKMHADPRVTRVGKFLRMTSLDELPQLVNVVRGEMALVGPRPALPSEVAAYEHDVRRRLVVKPGLTGLWQVSGRSDLPWEEAVRLDQSYVDNWSLRGDLSILFRTVGAVLRRHGAY